MMSYRIQDFQEFGSESRRIHREQLEKALRSVDALRNERARPAEVVHELRKRFKKQRALLRLWRDADVDLYQRWNRRYRDLGRELAACREATAQLEVAAQLAGECDVEIKVRVFRDFAEPLRAREAELCGAAGEHARERCLKVGDALETVGEPGFPDSLDKEELAQSLARTYGRGRDAWKACRSLEASPEQFHEWRKRSKYARYHLRLLQDAWARPLKALRKELHDLSDYLGDGHDLDELKERIEAAPKAFGTREAVELVLGLMIGKQLGLRQGAAQLGAKVYAEKPDAFAGRIADYCATAAETKGPSARRRLAQVYA